MRTCKLLLPLYLGLSCVPPAQEGGDGQNGERGPQGPAGPPGPGTAIAGTRLKPRQVIAADGARISISGELWDSKRKEACSFLPDETGRPRCLPLLGNAPHATGAGYFDASCTEPIFVAGCVVPKYGYSAIGGDVSCTFLGYKIYSSLVPVAPSMIFIKENDSRCRGYTPNPNQSYLRGTPVPPAEFVAGEIQTAQ